MTPVLFVGLPLLYVALYPKPISFLKALHHVYFLLFGQPSLDYVDDVLVEALNLVVPPLGLATVVDGGVRFAYLFFAKRRSDSEWIELVAESLRNHVVVCGAGRVGYRVTAQLLELGHSVVVVERREDAAFVRSLRDLNVPVLIDDVRSSKCLARVNIDAAQAIVCATDDDLSNLNVALDARRTRPELRVVLRLFDDDLVQSVRANFAAEAHSTSALAAPSLALAALDPRIIHSFHVGKNLMVLSEFTAGERLSQLKVGDIRDRFGGLTLSLKRQGGDDMVHPPGSTQVRPADTLTVQSTYADYLGLRTHTGEVAAPRSAKPSAVNS